MKKEIILLAVLAIVVSACHNSGNGGSGNDTAKAKIIHADGIPGQNIVPSVFVLNDSIIKMDLVNLEKGTILSAEGELNGENTKICEVNIGQAKNLFAELTQDNAGTNIHFSRISYPDHQDEGLSSNELRIGIFQPGQYRLFITQDKSAKPARKFKIRVWMK